MDEQKHITDIREFLINIQVYLNNQNKYNETISLVNVGWHLYHTLKVIVLVNEKIRESKAKNYQKSFVMARWFCFTFNFIPRGKGKAPQAVKPPETFVDKDILTLQIKAENYLDDWESIQNKQYIKHPVFGKLDRSQTIQFLSLHTRHHQKIINQLINISS